MSRMVIDSPTSDSAKEVVIEILKAGFEAHSARIHYNISRGLPRIEDTDKYPLILSGTIKNSNMSIHVYSVAVGYNGEGPNAMVDILEHAGFKFDKNDILTNRRANYEKEIILSYTRWYRKRPQVQFLGSFLLYRKNLQFHI